MRGKGLSIGLRAALAICAVTLFLVSARAVAQETVLYSFTGGSDGYGPVAGLIFDGVGNLYGTTKFGTVFELSPKADGGWTEKTLYSFPYDVKSVSGLIFDGAANLYGTTEFGVDHSCGGSGCGTVFELSPKAGGRWTEKVLHRFNGKDGEYPMSSLIFDAAGNLYGTTSGGGSDGLGTVFELSPKASGAWMEKLLHSFISLRDGESPDANLIFDASGNLYGTTFGGPGTLLSNAFELSPKAGGGWTKKTLHTFGKGEDGSGPSALIFDAAGNLYGTTYTGGNCENGPCGTVFELSPKAGGGWTEKVLHDFNGKDGWQPVAGLIGDAAGNLYGTTVYGGAYGAGTVFELTPKAGGGWAEKVLHGFGNGMDGILPWAGLLFDAAGNLYGTTYAGGAHGYGTVFEIKH